jgi:nucleotide-binding universal stress UspA family protein
MTNSIKSVEDLLLNISQEIHVKAPLNKTFDAILEQLGPHNETPEGNPGPVLTQIASGSDDVLVVGTRPGPSIKRAVHGSVSAHCTAHARCPVTVVTPGAFGRQPGMSRNTVPTSRQARGPGRRARR